MHLRPSAAYFFPLPFPGAVRLIPDMLHDVRFAVRMLRRNPGFSLLAVLCLTLGIGATTSVFSWIEGILLRPFPMVADQGRLMAIAGTERGSPDHTDVSSPDLADLARSCKLFDAFVVDRITSVTLAIGDRAQRTVGSVVSANYFDAMGVHPILGRGFLPEEDYGRNAHPVAVIGYRMWQEAFRGDPNVVGQTQRLNGVPHTIVGVMPKGFDGTFVGWAMQFWVPTSMQETFDPPGFKLDDRGARWIEGYAKLKPGVTAAQAQAEVSAVARQLEADYPETNRGLGIRLYPLYQTPFNNAGTLLPTLRIALAVVSLVLLIACANVGNLLLVRSFGRRREMTIRLAVGAGRGRLLRQLLIEGLLLAALASAGGLLLANWCRNLVPLLLPQQGGLRMSLPGEIDWRVLLASAAVCVAASVLFGLIPATQAGKIDLASSLKAESGGVVSGRGRALVRSGLVLVQVGLSFVLVTGAGLLLKSLQTLRDVSPGFSSTRVMTTSIDLTSAGYNLQRARTFQDSLIDRMQSLAGVKSAAFARVLPFAFRTYSTSPVAVEGYDPQPNEMPAAEYGEVGPGYLATMGIPLVSGREFIRADNETSPPVAVINETMAAQYWRGQDPVGRRFHGSGKWLNVVGVAKTSKYHSLREVPEALYYIPLRQGGAGNVLMIRSRLGPEVMAKALSREVHALDTSLAPGETIWLREQVDRTTGVQRVAVGMLAVFGGLALLLAGVGLYGVMSYAVSQSSRELALRMALGASGGDVLRTVMSYGLWLTGGGILLGAAAALELTRLMGDLLYKVSPRDPSAFAAALAVMAAASSAACLLPAWRAMRTDPAQALRE